MQRCGSLLVASLLGATLLPGCGGGQKCQSTYEPSTTEPRGFLWEATAEGRTIILLGTHQAAGRGDVPARAWQDLRSSNVFVAEVDEVDVGDHYKSGESWAKAFTLPKGQSLMKLLSSDDYFDLQTLLKGAQITVPPGLPNEGQVIPFAQLKPWVAMLLLAKQSQYFPSPSLSEALLDAARDAKLDVEFFDTWEEQVAFLDESGTVAKLAQAIRDYPRMRCEIKDSVAAFRMGDDAALAAFVAADGDPLVARVQRWMPRLEGFAEGGKRVFLAVGLSHLVGPNGIVTRLQARGYQLKRL